MSDSIIYSEEFNKWLKTQKTDTRNNWNKTDMNINSTIDKYIKDMDDMKYTNKNKKDMNYINKNKSIIEDEDYPDINVKVNRYGMTKNIIKDKKDNTVYTELQANDKKRGGKRKRKTLKRKRSKKTKNNKKSRKSKRKMTRRRR